MFSSAGMTLIGECIYIYIYIYIYINVWLMSMFLVLLAKKCWIYEAIYVSSNVRCYKCGNKVTMTECCMIMLGFGKVWEHDNHTLNVMELLGHAE